VLQLVEGFMPECRWLDDGETLTYLHACVSNSLHRARVPEIPMFIGRPAADRRACYGPTVTTIMPSILIRKVIVG
jgi:hypothetical protein